MKNGYFRLMCTPQGTAVAIFAPEEGGVPVQVKELSEYLGNHGVAVDYALLTKGLQDAAASTQKSYSFAVSRTVIQDVRESYALAVSPDRMNVQVRFFAPSMNGQRMSAEEFIKDLRYRNICYGIKEQEIKEFFQNPNPPYCMDVIVAEGKQPRHGEDARIEYYFEIDRKAKPTLNEDGSVDFFHLNTISHCKKGDLLARLIPEDPGENGFSVFNETVKPRNVKKAVLKHGRNIIMSEDKRTLTSDVSGHVMLYNGKVFVSDVFEVENVDISTGNIDYEGSVKVNGNVCTGFEIKASGNVEVAGVVEGARIFAGGNIIIARGMNGMARGELSAGGNIVAKFIENSKVQAEGSVSTESILHSNVSAGTFVSVTGKKGFITGGRVSATSQIQVKTLGSPMGADTLVEVGLDPVKKQRMLILQKQLADNNRMLAQITPVLAAWSQKLAQGAQLKPDQIKMLRDTMEKEKQLKEQVEADTEEYQSIQELFGDESNANIEVSGSVYSGTKIAITDVSLVVKDSFSHCRFVKNRGDVKMLGL